VRLVRYHFFKSIHENQAANDEIEAAVKLAPKDLSVILVAANDALQSNDKGVARARRWLDTIPENQRGDLRVLKMRGVIDVAEGHLEAAVDTWRKGLEQSDGSDPELSWHLAYALLQLGRDDEAGKLVSQYRRLVGDANPTLKFLEAIQDEHAGRFILAIESLQSARDKLGPELQEAVCLALGRCQEKQKDEAEAEKTYRAALQVAPNSTALRVALAHLLLAARPAEAEREIMSGLAAIPDDPALLVILAQAKLLEQMNRTPERRNWADFDAAFARAAAAAPHNPMLALMHSERLAKDGDLNRAVAFLKEAAGEDPNSAEIAMGLAEGLIQQGQHEEALKVLERASAPGAAGDRATLRVQRARLLMTLGRGREARAMLIRDVERLPAADHSVVWKTLTQLCDAQGDRDAARAALNEWAQKVPDDPEPRLALLELAIETGDEPSIRARLEALRPRENQDDLIWRLAQARERLWKRSVPDTPVQDRRALLQEANALVESVLRDTKINPTALLLQGQIYEAEGDWEKAIDSYTRSRAHGHPAALTRLVELLTQHGRKEELDKLRQSDARNQVDRIEALTFLRLGDREEAANIVEQSLQAPSQTDSWQAGMLDLLGTGEKAESALRRMAEQQPESLLPWLRLLRFQATHDRPQAISATLAQVKKSIKTNRPELLEAQCRWAANDRAAADQAFATALERHPDDREVEQAACLYYEETAQHDRAEACLRKILDRSPNDRTAARQLAIVLSAKADQPGSWEQAWTVLGPENPMDQTPEERLARAIVLARGADPAQREQATHRLEDLVADLPAESNITVAARDILARLLLSVGKPDRAARIIAVTASKSSNPEVIALYLEALLQSKQFETAEGQLDRLSMIPRGRQYDAKFRARLIQERSQPGEAAVALEQAYVAREKDPSAEAFGREAFRLLLGMNPDASEVADRLGRRLAGHNPALSWMPALVLARKGGDRDGVLALCQAATQAQASLHDLMESGRVTLEVAVSSHGDAAIVQKADAILAAALHHFPDADDLLVMKAMINHLQGRFDEEVRLYRIVLKHQPKHPLVLNNIAYALSEGLNLPSEALDLINELIRSAGPNAEYLDTRGMILVRLGQFDKAIKDLEESVHSRPDGTHLFHLALAYERAGLLDKYQTAFEQAQKAGLSPETIDPIERTVFEKLRNL
jgi:cellulose synthase operon protein C